MTVKIVVVAPIPSASSEDRACHNAGSSSHGPEAVPDVLDKRIEHGMPVLSKRTATGSTDAARQRWDVNGHERHT